MIQLLQDVMWVMGRTTRHDHLFVKFQSALVPYMETIIKAFPDTPFIFLFRQARQLHPGRRPVSVHPLAWL